LAKEIELFQMRYFLKCGKLKIVTNWAEKHGFSLSDEISPAMIDEYDLFARILAMQGKETEAIHLNDRSLALAEKGSKRRNVIRCIMLKSLLLTKQNQMLECFQTLEDALSMAIPNGYFRIFLDEGAPLEQLLRQYVKARRNHYIKRSERVNLDDVKQILEAMMRIRLSETPSEDFQKTAKGSELLLTRQEKNVLHLMNKGLTNKEMAGELGISLSTVKTHINHLYRKLGVGNRMLAIKKAQELDLLSD